MKIIDDLTILKWDYLNDNLTKDEYLYKINSLIAKAKKSKKKDINI